MPRRSKRIVRSTKRSIVPRNTQKIRKLAGMAPLSRVERIASGIGQAAVVAKQVAMLSGLINSEVKFLDTASNGANDNTGTFLLTLNNIAEGDDTNQRNGRWILSKSVQVKLAVTSPAAQTAPSVMGWALVMDKKASIGLSATPWTDVFATADAMALINRAESERFVILKRGTLDFTPGGQQTRHINKYINLKGIHVKFNGTGATNYDQNRIFFTCITNVAANTQTLTGNCRYDYYDN